MIILSGKEAAEKVRKKAIALAEKAGHVPSLAIVRAGSKAGDLAYERGAKKTLSSLSFKCAVCEYPEDVSEIRLVEDIGRLGRDSGVDGILVFSPLPAGIDAASVMAAIPQEKDVDGASPKSRYGVYNEDPESFAPCTAQAVMEILSAYDIDITGKRVTILGYGANIGKPLSQMMLAKKATVSVCRSRTPREDAAALCRGSDIIVAAAGIAGYVDESFITDRSIIIDVGINARPGGGICGDVLWDAVQKAKAATPVPGGVGAVTTSVLALNLARAALMNKS